LSSGFEFDLFDVGRVPPTHFVTAEYDDTDLGVLKTGKEAEVSLVERRGRLDGSTCLLARKRYRPRNVSSGELRELGFTKASTFRTDVMYRDGRNYGRRSRDARAVERMTNYGKELVKERWTHHEFTVMRAAWNAGVRVPYPVELFDDGFVMEYLGDIDGAAPRLRQVRLESAVAAGVFDELIEHVGRLAAAGYVHADLSPYNVLWWDDAPWIIDFPQAVDFGSPHAITFLRRDIANLAGWYSRHGGVTDPDHLVEEILRTTHR